MTKREVMAKVQEILRSHCDDPAEQIIREGTVLKALQGLSLADARAVVRAVVARARNRRDRCADGRASLPRTDATA